MHIDRSRVQRCLKEFDFNRLFIEELGWDRHLNRLDVSIDGRTFALGAVAQKRGMAVFTLVAPSGEPIPGYPLRRKIERQVARSAHEHLLIFTDADRTTQIWQWVKHEAGKPTACREHAYHRGHSGEALAQKLESIAFALDEEEDLTLVNVAGRARAAFDVDKVTKKFYERFKAEHAAFQKFIKGIKSEADLQWYTSLMLNRRNSGREDADIPPSGPRRSPRSDPRFTRFTGSEQRAKVFWIHVELRTQAVVDLV